MHLTQQGLQQQEDWNKAGIRLPKFDRAAVTDATIAAPIWIHFGAGNIFRAFLAAAADSLLERGLSSTGIIVAEGYDEEIIDRINLPHDHLSLLVTLKADGQVKKSVTGSVVQSLKVSQDFERLQEIFACPSLQMASFTITEKGYAIKSASGEFFPAVAEDLKHGPENPQSFIGKLAALCLHRYRAGAFPLSLVSMDNCSHNGTRLMEAVMAFAESWESGGLIPAGFKAYLQDAAKIGFPWTMIDKITPRPDETVAEMLAADGLEDAQPVVTTKNTFVAPFVNAEETQYLVVEDWFPNGHPPLEQAGILFTERETVDQVEKMKVCTCLNPLHTALAVFGCLLGYQKISDEMKDADLVRLITRIGYVEGLPVVVDPKILCPREFLDTVVQVRLPNPFMPDTPQRIATDTSQKLSIRFGETIKSYHARGLEMENLRAIPLVLAAWCRYLIGIDDAGESFAVSPDPLYAELAPRFALLKLGEATDAHALLQPVFSNSRIFGVNLYEVGLGEKAEELFACMMSGPGQVRAVLKTID